MSQSLIISLVSVGGALIAVVAWRVLDLARTAMELDRRAGGAGRDEGERR